jgi:hypothetical protein
MQPSHLFLIATILITAAATAVLCAAIMSDYWELIMFDRTKVDNIVTKHNGSHTVLWLFGGTTARVTISRPNPAMQFRTSTGHYLESARLKRSRMKRGATASSVAARRDESNPDSSTVSNLFLVPMHGGIWTLCVALHGTILLFLYACFI